MAYGWRRLGNITRNMAWHKVTAKSGDTLQSIAKSVTPAQSVDYLKKWNGLSSNDIKAGQTYKVYPYYVVQFGDTLGDIAKSFETTVSKLHAVNPWIKNVNKIYPKEKVRLLDGMEPEEKPPAPAPQPAKPSEPAPESGDRNGAANDVTDDTVPLHRNLAGDYYLRIGDVQLMVPPEFIRVYRSGDINQKGMIRQRDTLKYKNGQSQTNIEIQLWFTNLEQINGVKVEGPISGQKYFMDGLRPLMAQFKRMPFLPIVNEFLNDVLDIHAVAFSNMTFSTVEGFPDVMQATVSLYKMDVMPYIQKPSWTYDQHFMYPVFRWYYNQMLVESKPTNSTTYLRPVYHADYTDDFGFSVLNEGFLYETKAENKLKSIELNEMAFDPVELPDDIHCTHIMGSFGSVLVPLKMDFRENPTFQYMGALDTQFQVRFETKNRDAIATLERMFSTVERYSRMFRDKIVTGYVQVKNSVLNMAGVYNVMIQDMTVSTVPGYPDLFAIDMTLTSYHDTQYQDQRLYGQNMVDTKAASAIAAGNVGPAKKYLYTKREPWFLVEEGIAEGMLDNMELYPDLELPTYGYLNEAIKKINAFRKKKGHSQLPVTSYTPPSHKYRDYGSETYSYYKLPDGTYVEPDFYFTYPEWDSIKYVDVESIDQKAMEMQGLIDGFAKQTTGGETNANTSYGSGSMKGDGSNAGVAWNFFVGKGFSEQATAGILGNLQQESGIDPKKKQYGGGPGRGIGQWTEGGRWAKLTSWAGKNGKDPWALTTQLEYIWQELNGADPTTKAKLGNYGGLQGLMKQTSINKSVEIFEKAFERAGKPMYEKRYKYAQDFYEKFTGSSAAGGGGGASYVATVSEALFEHAEADVLVPIPKKDEEESDITAESGNPNALMRSMMHDSRKYSKRGTMVRAFPTFVLAFVDEGRFVDYRRMWNNYYLYHAVEEINVVKERSHPVDTVHIRLVNIYGALNSTNRPLTKATAEDVRFPGWGITPKAIGSAVSWFWHQWFPSVTDDMIERRMEHIQKTGFELRTGARVHLRMGYGSVASMMPIVFNGRVTEMDSADMVEIVCQSDGLELINPFYEWAAEARTTWWSMRQEPKNIIDNLLVNRKGADWLANYDSIFGAGGDGGTESKFGIEHFGYVIGKDHAAWDIFAAIGSMWEAMTGQETVNGYDARKNIYTSNGVGSFGQNEEDGFDETNVHFWMTNKSPWDVMQLLTAVAPDYELKVHEHGFHSTLFYGQPQWYVKYAYRNVSGDPSDMDGYKEVLKVSQQYHSVDSMQDIITNHVKANGTNLCTVAVPIYSWDEKPKAAPTIFADPHIKPELQKTEMVDIGLLQDFPMLDFIADAARWVGHNITEAVYDIGDALVSIPGKGIIEDFGNFLKKIKVIDQYSRTEKLAIEGAKSHIQWKFREMYKGDIIVIGDSAIRPGDMLNICDTYTQMFGQVEVGRVVHMMSMNEGFVTAIKPDLLAVRKDGTRIRMLNVWAAVGTNMALRVTAAIMRGYIARKPTRAVQALAKTTKFIRGLKAVRNAKAAGGIVGAIATTGPFALGFIIFELALWVVTGLIIEAIEAIIYKQRAGVAIMPLWYKNRPYVAGIDGHKELIPGYWDENYWGPVDGMENVGSGGTVGSNVAAAIPEGKSWVVPAPSNRVTAPFGQRRTDAKGKTYYHQGTDYGGMTAGVEGDPIYAAANGTVVFSGKDKANSYGNYIIVDHGDVFTLYAHLKTRHVNKGDSVVVGQVIALMGNTGNSFGAHLHLEVRKKTNSNYFKCSTTDPVSFLNSKRAHKVPKDDPTLKR